ncbi:hypothetical protein ABPG75_006119 [Micractinium tetrahymenae]
MGDICGLRAAGVMSSLQARSLAKVALIDAPDPSSPAWAALSGAVLRPALSSLELDGSHALAELPDTELPPGLGHLAVACMPEAPDGYQAITPASQQAAASALRALTGLTSLKLTHLACSEATAAAAASLPRLRHATLLLEQHPSGGLWQAMQQLGARLRLLSTDLSVDALPEEGQEVVDVDSEGEEVWPDRPRRIPRQLLGLTALQELHLNVVAEPSEVETESLPDLDTLPTLRSLMLQNQVPFEAWYCGGLTSLHFAFARVAPPDDAAARLPALRRLAFLHCACKGGLLPPPLCGLPQLTSLSLEQVEAQEALAVPAWALQLALLVGAGCAPPLPDSFSQLSALRQLSIRRCDLEDDSLEALCPLNSLTELHLLDCGLARLPAGAYLARLVALHIARNAFPSPPAELGAATALRALALSLPDTPAGVQDILAACAMASPARCPGCKGVYCPAIYNPFCCGSRTFSAPCQAQCCGAKNCVAGTCRGTGRCPTECPGCAGVVCPAKYDPYCCCGFTISSPCLANCCGININDPQVCSKGECPV